MRILLGVNGACGRMGQRIVQLARLRIGECREIDARNLGADGGRELADRNGLVGHGGMIRPAPDDFNRRYLQVSMRGGAPSTAATLEMSRQRVPIHARPCTKIANRVKVSAFSSGVCRAPASSP